jgi:hypothetical protein
VLEDPLKPHQYVFIIAPGRSGSTLIQNLLNSIPNWLIRGENGGIHLSLIDTVRTARESQKQFGGKERPPSHPWFGITEFELESFGRDLGEAFVADILRPPPETRVVGFKEIRWNWKNLTQDLFVMQTLFPGSRFVLNTREPSAIAQSGWWRDVENSHEWVSKRVRAIEQASRETGDESFLLRYEEYTANPSSLIDLFSWLGEAWDLERVEKVLSERLTH